MNKYSVRIAYLLFLVAQEKKSKEENKDPQISCQGNSSSKDGLDKGQKCPVAPQDEAGLTKTFQTWPRGWFHIP